jgi:hypothetical protein
MNQAVNADQPENEQQHAHRNSQRHSEINRRHINHQRKAKKEAERTSDRRRLRIEGVFGHSRSDGKLPLAYPNSKRFSAGSPMRDVAKTRKRFLSIGIMLNLIEQFA